MTQSELGIKQLLNKVEGLPVDAEVKPDAEREIEKIGKIVREMDPRLDIRRQKIELGVGNYIEVSVHQAGFKDPITVFKIASELNKEGRVIQEARLSITKEEIEEAVKVGLGRIVREMNIVKRK